jgi:serine/threonine protein kinase
VVREDLLEPDHADPVQLIQARADLYSVLAPPPSPRTNRTRLVPPPRTNRTRPAPSQPIAMLGGQRLALNLRATQEIDMLIACREHPRVVGFIGANVDYPGSPMLVFEHMAGGSLAEMLEVHAACGFRPPRAAWLCWSARRPRAQTAPNAAAAERRVTSLCSPPNTLPSYLILSPARCEQLAEALHFLHNRSNPIIHRDIAPGNNPPPPRPPY